MPIKFKDLDKILKLHGISKRQGKKSTHFILTKTIDGEKAIITIAAHNNQELDVYVGLIREKFQLKRKHGISDKKFYGK